MSSTRTRLPAPDVAMSDVASRATSDRCGTISAPADIVSRYAVLRYMDRNVDGVAFSLNFDLVGRELRSYLDRRLAHAAD